MPNPLDPRPRKRGRPLGSKNIKNIAKLTEPPSKNGSPENKGQFKAGWKGGVGRPHGSRNKVSLLMEQIGTETAMSNAVRAWHHMRALAFGETDKGDFAACKYIYEAVCPPRKGARVDLGYDEDLTKAKTSKEVDELSRKV